MRRDQGVAGSAGRASAPPHHPPPHLAPPHRQPPPAAGSVVSHGAPARAPPPLPRRQSGFWLGNSRRASVLLIPATRGAPSTSSAENSRPLMTGMRTVRK